MAIFVSCGTRSLPRDLDVAVQVSKPQVEQTTDLSVAVLLVKDAPFLHGAGRIRYYSTLAAVEDDFATTTEAWRGARDFFAQTPRAQTMAIGKVFEDPVAGLMRTGGVNLSALTAPVADGSFAISIDGDAQNIDAIDFTGDVTIDDIAATVQAALRAVASGGFTNAEVEAFGSQLIIRSGTTGDASTVSAMSTSTGTIGTDVIGSGFLNGADSAVILTLSGYTPGTIADEMAEVQEAARCSGRAVYGWALERTYRDTSDQETASTWAQGRRALLGLVSNSLNAYDANITTDIGSVTRTNGDFRTFTFYHNEEQYYPEMAVFARALSVNYAQENSTLTLKFKDLTGIPTVGVTESQLTVLESKRYNTFTLVGNNSRTVREGVNANTSWFIDDLVNLDNFAEELQVNVYNLFLRRGKVPYNVVGVGLIRDSCTEICERYVFNGTFSARPVLDLTRKSGERIDPAYTVEVTPLALITVEERASRVGPPVTINANLTGAIHEVSIAVNAFN